MKITGWKAWLWAATILIGIGGVVYGELMRTRAHTYKGYKETLATEMRNHREDLAAHAKDQKACNDRQTRDAKTIKTLTEQRDRIAKRLWIGKNATVNITVAP